MATASVCGMACAQTINDQRTTGEKPVSYDECRQKTSGDCLILLHGTSGLSLSSYKGPFSIWTNES